MINIFFKEILLASILGSILFIFIICMKQLFKKIIDVSSSYKLWFILILCLLVPFIPVDLPDIVNYNVPKVTEESINNIFENINTIEVMQFTQDGAKADKSATQKNTKQIFNFNMNSLSLIWLCGLIGYFIYMCFINFIIRKMISESKSSIDVQTLEAFNQCKLKMGITKQISVVSVESIEQPCIYGFFKPVVLLSNKCADKLSQSQKEYIFIHELSHYLRKDNLTNWVLIALKMIYWFNPIIGYAIKRMKEESELACDDLALSYITHNEHKGYAMTIINLLDIVVKPKYALTTVSIINGRKRIERRINMIYDFKKSSNLKKIISCLIAIVIASVGVTTIFAFNNAEKKIEDTIVDNITNENSLAVNNDIKKMNYMWPVPGYEKIACAYGIRINPLVVTEKVDKKEIKTTYEESQIGNIKVMMPKLNKDAINNKVKFHSGIDIQVPANKMIVASESGIIVYSGFDKFYGNMIIIKHGKENYSIYGHCSKILVKENEAVSKGQEIARVGSTGLATGPHVHFSIVINNKIEDPMNYLKIGNFSKDDKLSAIETKTAILDEKAYAKADYAPQKVTISQNEVVVEGIENKVQHLIPNPKLSFTFKDGKKLNVWDGSADELGMKGSRSDENNTTVISCEFEEKIDIENIKSIVVDDIEYNL